VIDWGAELLAAYSATLGIPFLIAALMIEHFSTLFARMKGHLVNVERAMGVLMVVTGVGFLTGAATNVCTWLLEMFPSLQSIG
jgi:cytochrome c-type biogenesis protein